MAGVFISYARETEADAGAADAALKAAGYEVWRDNQLPAHRTYTEVIEESLKTAQAVLVIWSAAAIKSQWVRSEADFARRTGTLVQVSMDGAELPMPFDQIQCIDLSAWRRRPDSTAWRKVLTSVAELCGRQSMSVPRAPDVAANDARPLVAVLPFANRSGDADQDYLADGIAEDVITDLGKVSAVGVIARNTVFALRNEALEAPQLARRLGASHIVEGSIRRSGNRVRLTATLVDGVSGHQVWAERYDRDLDDIFALQDEISQAIVTALRLNLLPEERRSIRRRGTTNAEAFSLYLMARRTYLTSNITDPAVAEQLVRLCRRAVELDPRYARAWALMAGSMNAHLGQAEEALAAAETALALDDTLGEAHGARANLLSSQGDYAEATLEFETALRLEPDSYEINNAAGVHCFRQRRLKEAVEFFERAASLEEDDFSATGMLITCYTALGDAAGARSAARRALKATEKALSQDPTEGSAISIMIGALAILGEPDRAKTWIERALLLDPRNMNMRYNIACSLITDLKDAGAGLDILEPALAVCSLGRLRHALVDPDFDSVREHPRYLAMVETAKARLGLSG